MQRFKIVFLFQTTDCSEWSEPYWLEVAVFFLSKKYLWQKRPFEGDENLGPVIMGGDSWPMDYRQIL